ncbi:hypothetical protein [Streptomyces sp. BE133]|uniref:hypothetical protein n=1 Tax=Streptomyces sp. BE133 TaxID=3002523 RepID=UPI002E75FD93|nr:hypothetical protein [Streptomyces sp. BE133]MEE1812644.1 hypothetical protein [Streptomyces sp. BE133]
MTVRNVYLDCEFLPADQSTNGLVSIGLTDDQGVDYYAVNSEMDIAALLAVPWMVDNVWPYLPRIVLGYDEPGRILNHDDPAVQSVEAIRAGAARYFADTDATETRLFAYYGGQDICRLHSLWDNNWAVMPEAVPRWFFDIKALAVQAGSPELPAQDGSEHHALADARYNRAMHQYLLSLPKEN